MEKKENRRSRKNGRLKWIAGGAGSMLCLFFFTGSVWAASDEEITDVLLQNSDIFICNDIFRSAVRSIGWAFVKLFAWIASNCAELFDTAFQFIDFTQYPGVQEFIASFKPVFVALVCASLAFLGIILIFWHEKKPKLAMNICLAVLVVTSSTYLIQSMNSLVGEDIRGAILGSGDVENASTDLVSSLMGASVYDLLYLDQETEGGLTRLTEENRSTLPGISEEDIELIEINEVVKPEDVQGASEGLMEKKLHYYPGNGGPGSFTVSLEDIYNGVAWTDLLNEYYYRYSVTWFYCIMGLLSISVVYISLAYKVIRIVYEIVIHQLLAYLYSANLTGSQKVLKILDSIKDSYITLILVLVCVKVYVVAYYFINNMSAGGFTKALFLLFVSFAVADGPNIIQKLTGIDAGLSGGAGRMLSGIQSTLFMASMLPRRRAGGGKEKSGVEAGGSGNSVKDSLESSAAVEEKESMAADGRQDGGLPPDAEVTGTGQQAEGTGRDGRDMDEPVKERTEEAEGAKMEENAPGMPEGSGFREEDAGYGQEAGNLDDEDSAGHQPGGMEEDLNGLDPMNAASGGQNGLDEMEKDLDRQSQGHGSSIEKEDPVEYGGSVFRPEWKEELERGMAGTSPLDGRREREKPGPGRKTQMEQSPQYREDL